MPRHVLQHFAEHHTPAQSIGRSSNITIIALAKPMRKSNMKRLDERGKRKRKTRYIEKNDDYENEPEQSAKQEQ